MERSVDPGIYFVLFAGTLAMFVLAAAIIAFFLIYQRRLARNLAHVNELRLAHQSDLLFSIIQTQEAERKRIAADLHDEVGAALAAVNLGINRIGPSLHANPIAQEMLLDSKEALASAVKNVREIAHNLMPPVLQALGLEAAIKALCNRISGSSKLEIRYDIEIVRLDAGIELALYRIVQELLTNTIKHSEANCIDIKIRMANNEVRFRYSDNGRGYDADRTNTGLGLKNIESRIQLVSGSWQRFSHPGRDTGIELTIPLHISYKK